MGKNESKQANGALFTFKGCIIWCTRRWLTDANKFRKTLLMPMSLLSLHFFYSMSEKYMQQKPGNGRGIQAPPFLSLNNNRKTKRTFLRLKQSKSTREKMLDRKKKRMVHGMTVYFSYRS